MTVREYIERKNELIKKYTGMILVPEDQIIDMELPKDETLSINDDRSACPYCFFYFDYYDCSECPMSKAGNCCLNKGSTYQNITRDVERNIKPRSITDKGASWYEELCELIEQFNEENQ